MRKVKFRGKRVVTDGGRYIEKTEGREWVYGSLIEIDEDNVFIFPGHEGASTLSKAQIVGWGMIAIDPETAGQYTGRKDKNGKEIYEGDILELIDSGGNKIKAVCKFGNRRLTTIHGTTIDVQCYYFEVDGRKTNPVVNNYCGKHDLEIMEIVGNVFENPELLQEAK